MNKGVKCTKISVNCIENDINDIRKGEPDYLGYIFFVEDNAVEELIFFIESELKKENLPLISISKTDYEIDSKKNIWNKEQIKVCIKATSAYLLRKIEKRNKKLNKRRK